LVPISKGERNPLTLFIDPNNGELPSLCLLGYSRSLNLEKMNVWGYILF